jgi:hypothetical protein
MASTRLSLTTDTDDPAGPASHPEEWRDIPGWEGYYQASSHGRIQSLDRVVDTGRGPRRIRGVVLKPRRQNKEHLKDHLKVDLCRDSETTTRYVHHLVAAVFVGPRPEGKLALHADGNETNNAPSNLYYGTGSDNNYDAVRHGTHRQASATHCKWGHLLAGSNITLLTSEHPHHRGCRACNRAGAVGQREGFHRGDPQFKAVADRIFGQLAQADEVLVAATTATSAESEAA